MTKGGHSLEKRVQINKYQYKDYCDVTARFIE